jgi:hypothetical protein
MLTLSQVLWEDVFRHSGKCTVQVQHEHTARAETEFTGDYVVVYISLLQDQLFLTLRSQFEAAR